MKRCAQNPCATEYTLCGWAEDAPETEDDVEPFTIATDGQSVTCDDCRQAIAEIKRRYKNMRKVKP